MSVRIPQKAPLTKEQWIQKYGGQERLDAECFEVVPCIGCDDTICHGWKVQKKRATRAPQRVYGTTLCHGCNEIVDVIWVYTNSDNAIGLIDHINPHGTGERCPHAGLEIWRKESGWTEERFRQQYGEASIVKAQDPVSPLAASDSGPLSNPIDPVPAEVEELNILPLLPCLKCGGRYFKIDAVYAATDRIKVSEEGDDFEVLDTSYGDGEWVDDAIVRCCGCGDAMLYKDWSNRERTEDGTTTGSNDEDEAGEAAL